MAIYRGSIYIKVEIEYPSNRTSFPEICMSF